MSEPADPVRPAELTPELRAKLAPVIALLSSDPASLTSVRRAPDAWRVHVADSLTGIELVRGAERIADVGAGAGFPALVLAAALPGARVDAIESVSRKCDFIGRAAAAGRLENVTVVCERAETWAAEPPPAGGRDAYEVVTARAVGRLSTLAELAVPLLAPGGRLVAWKGRRDPDEEAELERAAGRLAMTHLAVHAVGPFAGSEHRHLHVIAKTGPTPADLPRRPGIAKKRPFGRRDG